MSTHANEKVRQLAKEMQEDVNNKKRPWEKVREFLGDSANVVTILSAIVPFVSKLLQIPEIQNLPENVLKILQGI